MNLGLQGRCALVGGASSGLGRAIAHSLRAEGCKVALWSRPGERLDAAVTELTSNGPGGDRQDVVGIGLDASFVGSGAEAIRQARSALGGLDIVVLNGGGPPPVDATQTDVDGWTSALRANMLVHVEAATEALPDMRRQRWGRIVAVLSSGIRTPIPNLGYSNAARSGLAAWLKTVAGVVASDGVTVNGVIPGRIATPRVAMLDQVAAEREGITVDEVRRRSMSAIPIGRYGDPSEFAALVTFLCSVQAAYQTGTMLTVDGGLIPVW